MARPMCLGLGVNVVLLEHSRDFAAAIADAAGCDAAPGRFRRWHWKGMHRTYETRTGAGHGTTLPTTADDRTSVL